MPALSEPIQIVRLFDDRLDPFPGKRPIPAPGHHQEKRADAKAEPTATGKPKYNYLELLNQKHQRKIHTNTTQMDFTQIDQRWSLTAFTGCLASLMGKPGSHAFDNEQLTLLKQTWDRYPTLNAAQVISAFAQADIKNIHHFILQLGK